MADEAAETRQLAPPYTAFQSLKNLFGTLKENGLPGRVDRSLLNNFSGQVASQILTALRFLTLIDSLGHPTNYLQRLINAHGTDAWPSELEKVIRLAYAPLLELNLATASPAQFNDAFRRAYPVEGDTFRKCVTFFLNAAREAEIPISSYIMQNKKPRVASSVRRKIAKPNGSLKGTATPPPPDAPPPPPPPTPPEVKAKPADQVLLEILDPSSMTTDEQQAVFTLLLYLKKQPQQNGDSQ